MGADLYLNPPQEKPRSLSQRVADMEEENRSYRRNNAQLAQLLKDADKKIRDLELVIETLRGLSPGGGQ